MLSFTEIAAKANSWSHEYCAHVVQEYERFLHIKNTNSTIKLCPSDDIEIFWQHHVLHTEIYYGYCMDKFNRVIPYDKSEFALSNDVGGIGGTTFEQKKQAFLNTCNCYKLIYGQFINKNVWSIKLNLSIDEFTISFGQMQQSQLRQQNQLRQQSPLRQQNTSIPSYQQNKPITGQIKIYINYLNQLNQGLYNKEIITLIPSNFDTINILKDLIVSNLNVKKEQIQIKPHSEISPYVYRLYVTNDQFNDSVYIKTLSTIGCDFFIVEINDNFTQPMQLTQPILSNYFVKK